MEKSNLENIDDKVLVYVCKQILEEFNGADYNPFESESDYDTYEENIKVLGIGSESIDIDYLYNVIKLNERDLEDEDFNGPLNRPEAEEYYLDTNAHETVWQMVIYRHRVSSYSEDTVKPKFQYRETMGDVSVWEGRHIDTHVGDQETTDVTYGEPEPIKKR